MSNKPDVELLSKHLPPKMAQRFAAASQLVDCCKSLGFKGDLGYQTVLYSNHIELRRIFMWLIEKIPKSEDKTDSFNETGDVSRSKALEKCVLRKLATDLQRPWLLEFLQPPRNVSANPMILEKLDLDDQTEGNEELQSFHLIHSIIEYCVRYFGIQAKVSADDIPSGDKRFTWFNNFNT